MTALSCPRRRRGRWRLALLLSVGLHALALATVARLPGRAPPAAIPGPQGEAQPPADEECDAVIFLAGPAQAARPAPLPPTPPLPPPHAPAAEASAAVGPLIQAHPYRPFHEQNAGSFANLDGGAGRVPGQSATTFFQVPTQAESVVYVLDHSASMGLHGALETAKRELLASLDRLPPKAHFQVIVYSSSAALLLPDRPGWLAATAANQYRVARALRELQAEGGTKHDQALPRALALQPDAIYFLTDADDLTLAEVRAVTQRNRRHSVIHVIELNTAHRRRPEMPLQVLARENGGLYQAVDLSRQP